MFELPTPFRPVRLSMYDWPEVHDAIWVLEQALQAEAENVLGLAPANFEPAPSGQSLFESWEDPRLLLTQTCGYPLVSFLAGKVQPILTPHYDAPGCDGPNYCSYVLVHRDSDVQSLEALRGKRAAFNSSDSQSGYNAFRHTLAPVADGAPMFSQLVETGAHLKSMAAVAEGEADACCTDAVCYDLVRTHRPELFAALRPIATSRQVPGLPLITSSQMPLEVLEALRASVLQVFKDPQTVAARTHVGITGFTALSIEDYAPLIAMRQEAVALGYPDLA
ncbi:phosphate/phosphite/phosphonate ABC transporter substrate-binding protein [Roseibium sp.]|uniref:phosphate/phosphite/phosphonate ABC transporter substrate-binding protein n=1 Tax=Roseibium sp. TaxID=1936156 RepID=UPI003A9845C3